MLCEKAYTVNAAQAQALISLAEEKRLLLAEAIWPRYMPMRRIIEKVLDSGVAGAPRMLVATLSCRICDVPRMKEPGLAGGALLDLGVYPLTFAAMYFGSDPVSITARASLTDEGMDAQEVAILGYPDGRIAAVIASMVGYNANRGVISCENGRLEVDDVIFPKVLRVFDAQGGLVAAHPAPPAISGYEYELQACVDAISNGWSECPQMPHAETVRMMRIMDQLRRQFGVKHPPEIEAV